MSEKLTVKLLALGIFACFGVNEVFARPMKVPRELGYTASKKNPNRRMTHSEALAECRRVYGRSFVARVQIKPSGKIVCWVIY